MRVASALMVSVFALSAFAGEVAVTFYDDAIVRVERFPGDARPEAGSLAVVLRPQGVAVERSESAAERTWRSRSLVVRQDKASGYITFSRPSGEVLLAEKWDWFERRGYGVDADSFKTKEIWRLDPEEVVYGLGIIQEESLSRRKFVRGMIQGNTEDYIPYVQSIRGWGLFWDNPSPTTYVDSDEGMSFESQVADKIDYYFMDGGSVDGNVALMRKLTGRCPMLPKWTYGYWISKERYVSSQENVDIVEEHRRRGIPLDVMVQDWQYWSHNYLWNAMDFLADGFRNAKNDIKRVHDNHAHYMISVWASFGPQTIPYRQLEAKGHLFNFKTWPVEAWLPGDYSSGARVYDPFSAEARRIYWDNLTRLWETRVDGWWMDSTEPDYCESFDDVKLGPNDREEMTAMGSLRRYRNAFPLMTVEGVYRNQRADARNRSRVAIMTRSVWAGQQRTGANTWSGDTGSSWEQFRRQIPAGIGFGMCGNPNYNTDIGGFGCGDYNFKGWNTAPENPQFKELNVRWMQFGAFNPIFRSHGMASPREIWRFGEKGEAAYDAMVETVRLRYSLMPYIYSLAREVSANDATFIRPLFADFAADRKTWNLGNEFMFGKAFLVAPVTHPQYTAEKPEKEPKTPDFAQPKDAKAYLPAGADWYDFFTNERIAGGREVVRKCTLSTFPLYVRAGSVVPTVEPMQWVDEKPDAEVVVCVYPGADGSFTLYEDAGDGYGYEKGEFSEIPLKWDDKSKKLTIGERRGSYPGMVAERRFALLLPDGTRRSASYSGTAIEL